jgi:hypothetical protein
MTFLSVRDTTRHRRVAVAPGTSTVRLILIAVLGGSADVERDLYLHPHRQRPGGKRGQKMGRPFKLTDHQKSEAIKRRNQGETLADIARSYNVHPSTISRLTA